MFLMITLVGKVRQAANMVMMLSQGTDRSLLNILSDTTIEWVTKFDMIDSDSDGLFF